MRRGGAFGCFPTTSGRMPVAASMPAQAEAGVWGAGTVAVRLGKVIYRRGRACCQARPRWG